MWCNKTPNGKYKFTERYEEYMTGKTRTVSVTLEKNNASSRKTAAQALASMIEARQQAEPKQPDELTFAVLVDKYREYQARTVKKSTLRRNYHACETLKKILGGDVLVSRLTVGYIKAQFVGTGKAPGTLNEHRARLLALISWAYESDYLTDSQYTSISKKFKLFKDVPHRQKIADKYLELPELANLLDSMKSEKWKRLTRFLVLSGLRIGEAATLERTDFDFQNHVIHVNKTFDMVNKLITTPKTQCSVRDVYIQPQLEIVAKDIILNTKLEMMARGFRTPLFICNTRGGHINYYSFNKYLRENAAASIGREITTHALRHTHASLLLADGVDIETISRRLGHENSKVTREIYLHVTKQLTEKDNAQVDQVKIAGL